MGGASWCYKWDWIESPSEVMMDWMDWIEVMMPNLLSAREKKPNL